jgi:hypothetical protein
LEKFIKDHAEKLTYITKEWLTTTLNMETVDKHIIALMEKESEKILEWAETKHDESFTGYFNPVNSFVGLESFYVYEKSDGAFYVEIDYHGEIEVETEVEYEEGESGYKYESKYNPSTDDVEIEPVYYDTREWKTKTKYLYPEVNIRFGITIREKNIQDVGIIDWDFS